MLAYFVFIVIVTALVVIVRGDPDREAGPFRFAIVFMLMCGAPLGFGEYRGAVRRGDPRPWAVIPIYLICFAVGGCGIWFLERRRMGRKPAKSKGGLDDLAEPGFLPGAEPVGERGTVFQDVQTITNSRVKPLDVYFEPWGMRHSLEPGRAFCVEAESGRPGRLEVVSDESSVAVFAWPGATMRVTCEGRLIDDFSIQVPEVPEGASTRSFVEFLFGRVGGREDVRSSSQEPH